MKFHQLSNLNVFNIVNRSYICRNYVHFSRYKKKTTQKANSICTEQELTNLILRNPSQQFLLIHIFILYVYDFILPKLKIIYYLWRITLVHDNFIFNSTVRLCQDNCRILCILWYTFYSESKVKLKDLKKKHRINKNSTPETNIMKHITFSEVKTSLDQKH